ncbi:ATP synthase F1 subunit delta [Tepidiforma sp.]|uniref:ATP synthase F1 subunit delta n=1 Tax=Tepidiforma sp. TaxID=2682230 RepID=UPI002ADD325B|nr:ATP synthase F1 subunit delta [Tepidiforma sp.]
MANVAAARRYAQAAFELARERGEVSRWRSDLVDIATVLVDSQLAPVLADPKVPLEQRFAALERVLEVSPLALNLAKLLVQKGRSLDARAVAEAFNRLADAYEGIAHAQVTTAVPLSEERLQEISRRIGEQLGETVVATNRVDPSIIGGAIIRVGDRLIDGSIRTRLKALRRELEGAR